MLVARPRRGRAGRPRVRRSGRPRPVSGIEIGIAVALALLVAAQWAGPTLLALDRGIYGGDSLWYHMPFAAHIAETGSVTELLFTDPLYLNWFYPQVSELLHADGLLALRQRLPLAADQPRLARPRPVRGLVHRPPLRRGRPGRRRRSPR